jgi:hypothetical protein
MGEENAAPIASRCASTGCQLHPASGVQAGPGKCPAWRLLHGHGGQEFFMADKIAARINPPLKKPGIEFNL